MTRTARSIPTFTFVPAGGVFPRWTRRPTVWARADGTLLVVTPRPSGRFRLALSLFSVAAAMQADRDSLVGQFPCITTIHSKARSKRATPTMRAMGVTIMDDGGYHPSGYFDGYDADWVSIGMMPGNVLNPSLTPDAAHQRWQRLAHSAANNGMCLALDDMSPEQDRCWKRQYHPPVAGPLNLVALGVFGADRTQGLLDDGRGGRTDTFWVRGTTAALRKLATQPTSERQDPHRDPDRQAEQRAWKKLQYERRLGMQFFILSLLLAQGGALTPSAHADLTAVAEAVSPLLWPPLLRAAYERALLDGTFQRAPKRPRSRADAAGKRWGGAPARRRI